MDLLELWGCPKYDQGNNNLNFQSAYRVEWRSVMSSVLRQILLKSPNIRSFFNQWAKYEELVLES